MVLTLGAVPWSLPAIAAWGKAIRPGSEKGFQPFRFLALWCIVVLVFFSLSGSKMAPYILPMFPALALLAAGYIDRVTAAALARMLAASALALAFVLAALPFAFGHFTDYRAHAFTPGAQQWFLLAAGWWTAGALAVIWAAARAQQVAAVVLLALCAMTAHGLILHTVAEMMPAKSTLALARDIAPYLTPATRIYAVQTYPQSLPFYLKRTLTLVDFQGELEFGLEREPQKALPSLDAFVRAWPGERDAIAIMKTDLYGNLAAAGLPMTLIARDAARIAVRRP
jgi:4-amino-4-deoxy-L-arabinose transferase-like glycosyltransferase